MLRGIDLTARVRNQTLVAGVSLDVRPGEVLAIVGPNGAGKSTLLRMLSGERKPTEGEVQLEGRPLDLWPPRKLAQRRAVLPQSSVVNFPFTAFEIALIGRAPHVVSRESPRDLEITRDALALAEVEHLAGRIYPTLSGGEQQRVQLARILAQIWEPPSEGARYLLLDEPISNLDLAHQQAVLGIARRLAGENVAVVAVLHDLNHAAHFADRILILRAGNVHAIGVPREVLTKEIIDAAFDVSTTIVPHPTHGGPLVLTS
jgi:iron complex transport system ATP-binding protein